MRYLFEFEHSPQATGISNARFAQHMSQQQVMFDSEHIKGSSDLSSTRDQYVSRQRLREKLLLVGNSRSGSKREMTANYPQELRIFFRWQWRIEPVPPK